MKVHITKPWQRMFVLLGSLSAAGSVFSHDLGITPELTARWWQWAISIPSSVNPLTPKSIDPTGAAYCMVGQQGEDWFLGGVFKEVDILPASTRAQASGKGTLIKEVKRKCTIPLGKSILIPVLNGECNTAEELANGNPAAPADLRRCAKTQADAVVPPGGGQNGATAYFGPLVHGRWMKSPIEVKRVYTLVPFSVTFSPDNILSSGCGTGGAFLCSPSPNPSLAQVDGYWAARVRPLKAGTYRVETFGAVPAFDFALRVTYDLTFVPPKNQ
jgi:hypothetical protein